MKSNCCEAPMRARSSGGVAQWFVCTCCGKFCDEKAIAPVDFIGPEKPVPVHPKITVQKAIWLSDTYCGEDSFHLDFWRAPMNVLAAEVRRLRTELPEPVKCEICAGNGCSECANGVVPVWMLQERIRKLRAALLPFQNPCFGFDGKMDSLATVADDERVLPLVTIGDLRKARRALEETK